MLMTSRIDSLRLVGALGLNKIMAGELSRLSRRALGDVRLPTPRKAGTGALVYPLAGPRSKLGEQDGKRLALLAVHYQRSVSRVLWDLYESRAQRLEPLYDELVAAVAADDRDWLQSGIAISVRARNLGAFAAGERQVVGAVKNAIIDGARARGLEVRVDADDPDVPIAVRMHDETLTLSLDLAGVPMNQRGYRQDGGEAPVRETLAAALVMLCRHDARSEALVDPMAGSGTIPIEAALMAKAAPLWLAGRAPAAHRIPGFGPAPVTGELFADTEASVFAADIDAAAVTRARRAAQRAGVNLRVAHTDFRDLAPADVRAALGERARRGVILCNPPYGERLGAGSDLSPLYRDLGAWCRHFRGWRAGFLITGDVFPHAFGGRPRIEKPIRAGGLSARFLLYDL
jgi:putative N6-adenine-specific DNA methylase